MPTTDRYDLLSSQQLNQQQQQQALNLIVQTERVAAALHGARKMGMDVPDLEVLWKVGELTRSGRKADMFVTIKGGSARVFTTVQRGESGYQRYDVRIDRVSDDKVYFDRSPDDGKLFHLRDCWLFDRPGYPCKPYKSSDMYKISDMDRVQLERAVATHSAWREYLSRYLEAVLGLPHIRSLRPGVKTEHGSLYVADKDTDRQISVDDMAIFRVSGEVLSGAPLQRNLNPGLYQVLYGRNE